MTELVLKKYGDINDLAQFDLFNDGDSYYFQGAPVGGADESGVPVQEEADQCCQTDKAMGSWRPTGDLVTSGLV